MSNINDTQLIELYCEKVLSEIERKEFEDRLKNDSEFTILYKQYVELTHGIEYIGTNETKQFLDQIENNLPIIKAPKQKSFSLKHWLSIAASIMILLAFKVFLQNTPKDIYNEYHQAYPLLHQTLRGEAQNVNTEDNMAYAAYSNGDYEKAIVLFDKNNKLTDAELFYKANALLENNQSEVALELFQLVESDSQLFDTQARWYIGLCYLNMNQTENAIKVFEKIANSTDSYKAKAKDILSKL